MLEEACATETNLIRAINAAPGDDTPRQAYADWLNKHDPNRAELIRIQCYLDQGDDLRSEHTPSKENIKSLKDREQTLISAMRVAPKMGELPGIREFTPEIAACVCDEPHRISFKRGMIDNLDLSCTPVNELPPDLHIGGNLNLFDTLIGSLSSSLHVGGNLNLTSSRIKTLPRNFSVGGDLILDRTPIISLPSGLRVGGDLSLFGKPITSLPTGLRIGGNLDLSHTNITEFPDDLCVEGKLDLSHTKITEVAARHILDMPNLSHAAKVSGLKTAGFPVLAQEAERQAVESVQSLRGSNQTLSH